MMSARHNAAIRWISVMALAVMAVLRCGAQSDAPVTPPVSPGTTAKGVVLDQVIAVVNDDLVLESDVDEERRFLAFQPFRDTRGDATRQQIIDRLINRTLVLQQEQLQPQKAITDAEVDEQLDALRKQIPACRQYHCETDAGWERFVKDQGFTMAELRSKWRERMGVLQFIEQRFRMGIRISPDDIKNFYEKTLLPQYAKRGVAPPKLESISDRIQEILLQQQVNALLVDWLNSLKAQGTVRLMRAGLVAP